VESGAARTVTARGELDPARNYPDLVCEVLQVVDAVVPADATVAVVSKGDDALLELGGRRAWHFPRGDDGNYAGHYPADGMEASAHLEALRCEGLQYLVFPCTALWWLQHERYASFRRDLETRYRVVTRNQRICVIFGL
jgi:hypothetical protein